MGDAQSFNRYSYVLNDPLGGVDPTGYWNLARHFRAFNIFAATGSPMWWMKAQQTAPYQKYIDQIVAKNQVIYSLGQSALEAGVIDKFQAVLAHGAAGCLVAVAQSGDCGKGAVSAMASKVLTFATDGMPTKNVALNIGVHAVVGGVTRIIAGGKFKDGAVSAAMGCIFNHLNTFNSQGKDATLGNAASTSFSANGAEGRYDEFGHGNGDNGLYRSNPATGIWEPYPVAELADAIRADSRWQPGMEVKLWACNVGIAATYVQQQANALASPITAATSYVWFQMNGAAPYHASHSIDCLPTSVRKRFIGTWFDRPVLDGKWQTTEPVRK